jgi:hypothetical protein
MTEMYYTKQMFDAFNNIECPGGFHIKVEDRISFLKITVDEEQYNNMTKESEPIVHGYLNEVKKTLEDLGATIFLVKEKWDD